MRRHTIELRTSDIIGLFHGTVLELDIPEGMQTLTVLHAEKKVLLVFQGGSPKLTANEILCQVKP